MTEGLFRTEVLKRRQHRLAGDVVIAVPISWQVIGYLTFGALIASVGFLSLASYSRVEVVSGAIMPDAGIATILPTRGGIISTIDVRDGEDVAAGARLGAVRAEEDAADRSSTGERVEVAIAEQDASLLAQIEAVEASTSADRSRLAAQREGLSEEIAQLQAQIALQTELIATAEKDLERLQDVYVRGFISGRDMQGREEVLLTRRQGLAQLSQSLATRRTAMSEARRGDAQLQAQAQAQIANLSAVRAEVAQSAATASGARSYVLRAPVGGRVTAVLARVGQAADPKTPLMSIVPTGSVLRADLGVPSTAIAFVKSGQEVRLAIDAFPYQRFGTVTGKILTVAASPVSQIGPNGTTTMVYPVTVHLDQAGVVAFGKREPLVPGMTLTARIITERQSLLQWLFEPLFAVRRR